MMERAVVVLVGKPSWLPPLVSNAAGSRLVRDV